MQIRENTFTVELTAISVAIADGCLVAAQQYIEDLRPRIVPLCQDLPFEVAAYNKLSYYEQMIAERKQMQIQEQQRR